MKKKDFSVKDIIILSAFLIIAGIIILLFMDKRSDGKRAVVFVDNSRTLEFSLDEDAEYTIDGAGGFNKLVITNGCAYIEEADCLDKICVKQGRISKTGESIICLPHKVIVEIE